MHVECFIGHGRLTAASVAHVGNVFYVDLASSMVRLPFSSSNGLLFLPHLHLFRIFLWAVRFSDLLFLCAHTVYVQDLVWYKVLTVCLFKVSTRRLQHTTRLQEALESALFGQ